MSDCLIGPGQPCHECGEVYGQHEDYCSIGKHRREEHQRQIKEDSISKIDLMERIEKLEKFVRETRHE